MPSSVSSPRNRSVRQTPNPSIERSFQRASHASNRRLSKRWPSDSKRLTVFVTKLEKGGVANASIHHFRTNKCMYTSSEGQAASSASRLTQLAGISRKNTHPGQHSRRSICAKAREPLASTQTNAYMTSRLMECTSRMRTDASRRRQYDEVTPI